MIKFVEPTMEVEKLELCDVITTSGCPLECTSFDCDSNLGFG